MVRSSLGESAKNRPTVVRDDQEAIWQDAEMTSERMEVERMIPADAAAIFRVLSDPQGHVTIDSSGMLMDATGEPVTAVGDRFVVHTDQGKRRSTNKCRS